MLEYKNSKVEIHKDAFGLKEVQALQKIKDKDFFEDAIAYLFWMYKKNGIYSQNLPKHAKGIIKVQHLKKYDPSEIEKDKRFQALKTFYIDNQSSLSERFYLKIKEDMQALLDHIAAIPFIRMVKTNKEVEMDVDGDTRWVKVKVDIPIDNSEEKAKAIMLSEKLLNLEDKVSQKIRKEDQEKKIADSKALFDTNE